VDDALSTLVPSQDRIAQLRRRAVPFTAAFAEQCGLAVPAVRDLPMAISAPAVEATPVAIDDPYSLRLNEITELREAFSQRHQCVVFNCRLTAIRWPHPLIALARQLRDVLPVRWSLYLGGDSADGTAKIRADGAVGGTNEAQTAHQDGSLAGGEACTIGFWTESAPLTPAATFSQNVVRIAIDLSRLDEEAFLELFADDAISIVDHTQGEAAQAPILFASDGRAQVVYRAPGKRWQVRPANSRPAAIRGFEFLREHTLFGSPGSCHTYFDRPGRGLLLNNEQCVHARTAFVDDPSHKRVIASKTWTRDWRLGQLAMAGEWSRVGHKRCGHE
jgi:hypothetical protein